MNKIIIALLVLAALIAGWFVLTASNKFDYVATVGAEITELAAELVALDAQVLAGSLTTAAATEAKVRIVTRLNSINQAATASEQLQLTAAQRAQLVAGLERLKNILIAHQGTLNNVESSANETNVQAELARDGGSYKRSKHLNLVVADTIHDLEATVADSVQDYEANIELDTQIDTIVDATEAQVEVDQAAEVPVEATTPEATSTAEEPAETAVPEEPVAAAPTEETEPVTINPVEAKVSTEAEAEVQLAN